MAEGDNGDGLELRVVGSAGILRLEPGVDLTLGRDPGRDLILDHRRVSGRHAQITWEGGAPYIEDLGSAHGIKVDQTLVTRARLAANDQVEIGGVSLVVVARGATPTPSMAVLVGGPAGGLLEALEALLESETDDPTAALSRMLRGLIRALDAERAAVYLPAGEAGALRRVAVLDPAGGGVPDPSAGLLARVTTSGEPVLANFAETAELRKDHPSVAANVLSLVAAPLESSVGRGVVYLEGAGGREYGDQDRQLLESFAGAAAQLLRRARRRRRETLVSEVERQRAAGDELLGDSEQMAQIRAEVARLAPLR